MATCSFGLTMKRDKICPVAWPRTDMHVNFSLGEKREYIGLFAADGTTIDFVSFGVQSDDVSRGRYPDGSSFITNFTTTNQSRSANYVGGVVNTAPPWRILETSRRIWVPCSRSMQTPATLTFRADVDIHTRPRGRRAMQASSPTGAFSWTPGGAGTFPITVRVTDSGVPQSSDRRDDLRYRAARRPQFTTTFNGSILGLTWGTRPGYSYRIEYKDDLNDAGWTPLLTNAATGNGAVRSPPTR